MLPGLSRWYREPCHLDGCNGVYLAKGLCAKHYNEERQKRRYAENPGYFKAQAKRWQAENRERYRARKRQHHLENPHIVQERNRRIYEANREARKAASKAYAQAYPERGRENRRRRKALLKSYAIGAITPELLAAKLVYWGDRCWMCGGEPTTWDHVKPLSKGGAHCLANLRPACASCNSRKRARWPYPITGGPKWLTPGSRFTVSVS
jgi:5-methylcytosine-specific restriction endonuclease McrA